MSQAKVNRYKEEKANRKKIMAKQKAQRTAARIGAWAILVAIVAWAGVSVYTIYDNSRPVQTYTCDVTAMETYLKGLSSVD